MVTTAGGGSNGLSGMELIADAAYKAGFREPTQLATMIAIAMAESGGVANINNAGTNRNGTVDYGMWQINSVHNPDLDRIYDPYHNAQMAYTVHKSQGYNAWSAYNAGRHGQFMSEAAAAARKYLDSVAGGAVKGEAGKQMEPMTGKKVAQTIMAGLAKQVSGRAISMKLEGDGEVDDEDANFVGPLDGREPAQLETINKFLSSRGDQFKRAAEDAVAGMVDPSAPADDSLYDNRIPQVTQDDIAQWLRTGLKENAARGAAIARALGFEGTVHGVGQRGNASDHPHGNAIDLMTNDDTEFGWRLARFFVEFAQDLGVKYVIFDGQIASASRGWEWRNYTHPSGNTSNPTLMHRDHPHISFV